jgi:nucleotidyltransferase/DNA polymerase involved in DNA repair
MRRPSQRYEAPLVVSIKSENALRVHALDLRASHLGLRLGQPLANARAMVPTIDVVEADEAADAKLLEDISDWYDRFTPFVSLDPPHALPVAALRCDGKAEHALRRAGLKTIGQVASRQRAELTSRFGREFTHQLDRALGRGDKPISPRRPLPDFMAERRFADPVVTEDIIIESLQHLALQLGKILEERGKDARKLEAAFFRADGAVRRITIEMGSPTRDAKIIARLFRLKIDTLADPVDPGFGFDLIRLEATLPQTEEYEAIALGQSDREEREIDQLIDSLSTRFGPQRVLRFHKQDTHIPEAEAVLLPAQFGKPEGTWEARRAPDEMPRRPVRLLPRPEPISVMAQIPDGPPLRFRWRNMLHTSVRVNVRYPIRDCAPPSKLAPPIRTKSPALRKFGGMMLEIASDDDLQMDRADACPVTDTL